MIGKPAVGFMPSRLTRIMHGAYSPMPSVINAPSTKLPPMPSAEHRAGRGRARRRRREQLQICVRSMSAAATSSAKPMPIWIVAPRPARDDAGAEPRAERPPRRSAR